MSEWKDPSPSQVTKAGSSSVPLHRSSPLLGPCAELTPQRGRETQARAVHTLQPASRPRLTKSSRLGWHAPRPAVGGPKMSPRF